MADSIPNTSLTNKGWLTSSHPNVFNAAVGIRPRYAVCPDHTGSVIDLSLRDSSSSPRILASSAKVLNIDRRTADLIPSLPIRTSHVADVPSRNCSTRGSDSSEGSVYEARRFEKWIGMLGQRCLARSFCSTDLWNVYTSTKSSACESSQDKDSTNPIDIRVGGSLKKSMGSASSALRICTG